MHVPTNEGVGGTTKSCAARRSTRLASFASHDVEEVRDEIGRVFCEHDLRVVGKAQSLTTELHFRRGTQLTYGRLRYGATVDIDPGRLKNFYLLQLPVRGGENIYCGSRGVESNPRVGSIISPELGFHMRHQRGAEKLFVRIERAALERQCVAYYGEGLSGSLNFSPAIPLDNAATKALARMVRWQLAEAADGTLLDEPLIATQFEEALMLALLVSLDHNQSQRKETSREIAPGFIRHADAFIEHHAGEALTASTIARGIGVSTRGLFEGYRKYRGTSPMQHLRQVRLDAAHAKLSEPDPAATVTDVALHCGFTHLGRFAACYRQRFGELPSTTLRRVDGSMRLPAQTHE